MNNSCAQTCTDSTWIFNIYVLEFNDENKIYENIKFDTNLNRVF